MDEKYLFSINQIEFPNEIKDSYDFLVQDGTKKIIQNLEKINIFIGPNNSGKSRFLRRLFSVEETLTISTAVTKENYINQLVSDFNKIHYHRELEEGSLETIFDKAIYIIQHYQEQNRNQSNRIKEVSHLQRKYRIHPTQARVNIKTDGIHVKYISDNSDNNNGNNDRDTMLKKIYLPVLRGVRNLDSEKNDFYCEKTNEEYFNETNKLIPPIKWFYPSCCGKCLFFQRNGGISMRLMGKTTFHWV